MGCGASSDTANSVVDENRPKATPRSITKATKADTPRKEIERDFVATKDPLEEKDESSKEHEETQVQKFSTIDELKSDTKAINNKNESIFDPDDSSSQSSLSKKISARNEQKSLLNIDARKSLSDTDSEANNLTEMIEAELQKPIEQYDESFEDSTSATFSDNGSIHKTKNKVDLNAMTIKNESSDYSLNESAYKEIYSSSFGSDSDRDDRARNKKATDDSFSSSSSSSLKKNRNKKPSPKLVADILNKSFREDSDSSQVDKDLLISFNVEMNENEPVFGKIFISEKKIHSWKCLIEDLVAKKELMEYALSKSRSDLGDFESLKEFIRNSPGRNDVEKVWVVFCWLTHNIDYDANCHVHKNYRPPGDPFSTGKAVSVGFSQLFCELCECIGVKARSLNGFAKGFFYKGGQSFAGKAFNHDWNMVFVKGKWRFVECTWAQCYVNKKFEAVKLFEPFWLFTPPQIFALRHLPANCEDQLLEKSLTLDEFEKMPNFSLSYFRLGFKMILDELYEIKRTVNPFKIEISAPESVSLIGSLYSGENCVDNAVFIQRNKNFEVNIVTPGVGRYKLVLFGADKKKVAHEQLVEFCVQMDTDVNKELKWCQAYTTTSPVYLFEPQRKRIKVGESLRYKVHVAKANKVALIDANSNFIQFRRAAGEANVWLLESKVECAGDFSLSCNFAGKSYETAFVFNAY